MNNTASTVVEGSTTPSMTFYITSASPQRNSSASPMFTGQPSSTYVFLSSSGVYLSMKFPESSPVNYSSMPYSTQIYNSNGTPTISIYLELHVWPEKNMHTQDSLFWDENFKWSLNVQ